MTTRQVTGRLTARDLTAEDLDSAFDVRSRSFGRLRPSLRTWWNDVQRESINEHRAIGAFDGERLLAQARVRWYQQLWGSRPMPMGGVAGLVVAPDARGRGVSLRLVTALAQRSLEPDDPVSALPGHHPDVPGARLGCRAQHRISTRAEAFRTFGCKDVSLPAATDSDLEPFRLPCTTGMPHRAKRSPAGQ